MPKQFLIYTFPLFFLAIGLESLAYSRRGRKYPWKSSAASLAVAVGHQVAQVAVSGVTSGLVLWVWQHRVATLPIQSAPAVALVFLIEEFVYYWHHRASHEVRLLWATHSVHHSPNEMTLSAAYRLPWTGFLLGPIWFALPVVWLGVPPKLFFGMLLLNLAYQFFIHTELVPKLGVLEAVLNTPSHHRVHHASNADYLDKNYGGVLIVFDRLFGTYAEEMEPCRYGLTHRVETNNPIRIAFYEWKRLTVDVLAARTWRDRWRTISGSPALT